MSKKREKPKKVEPFSQIYDTLMPGLYRYVRYQVGDSTLAQRLTRSILQQARQQWQRVQRTLDSPGTWLFSLAQDRLVDHTRHKNRPFAFSTGRRITRSGLSTEEAVIRREEVSVLMAHLGELDQGERTALTLCFAGELVPPEIAQVLGIAEGSVATLILQGLENLQRIYQGEQISGEERAPKNLQAKQLSLYLAGETAFQVDTEVIALVRFARSLPWNILRPDPGFVVRLRRRLLKRGWWSNSRPFSFSWLPKSAWSYAMAIGLIVVCVIAVLALVGPRISETFNTVYNALDGGAPYSSGGSYRPRPISTLQPSFPGATPLSEPATVSGQAGSSNGSLNAPEFEPLSYAPGRMIIKDAEMNILVDSTDAAIDRIMGIAAQFGGYLAGMRTWHEDGYKEATIVVNIPAQNFEPVLRRVRDVALQVEREAAQGQDVTDQYVDLESQLRNLEATAERVRSFLDRAQTVEEALQVNEELKGILEQIEIIKGKMNYLEQSASFSRLTIEIRQTRPTPTPTRTSTPTAVPTATPTPTPDRWQPGETFAQASRKLSSVGRWTWEALIWVGVVVVPIVGIPVAAIALGGWGMRRLTEKKE
jgi:RNA polymerase sigma factor (sigma-70 family)